MRNLLFIASLLAAPAWAGITAEQGPSTETTNNAVRPPRPLPDYFRPGVRHPLGARPDCSETPVSIQAFEELARNGGATNIVDFVNRLPAESFQTFTLVTNSKSLQRGEGEGMVSEEWPRILRTSADGRITFSYTCNPASSTYNKIEVMYFDDNGQRLRTMSIDLAQQGERRVHHDDQRCLSCHATTMPDGTRSVKPIWPEYFQWGGCQGANTINLYGSNDDNMNPEEFRSPLNGPEYRSCDKAAIEQARRREIESFNRFRQNAANNPCFATLPWANPQGQPGTQFDPAINRNYPYASSRNDTGQISGSSELENYYLRPNLKFTELYARLNARRIAGLVERSPNYERIKYYLALESADCLSPEDDATINQLIPGLNYAYTRPGSESDPAQATPLLYAYTRSIGMTDADWTLEFRGQSREYNAAIPRTSMNDTGSLSLDTGIPEVASAAITSSIARTDQRVGGAMTNALTRGVSEGFGPQWSCIDDTGGAIREGFRGPQRPLCLSLRASLAEQQQTLAEPNCPLPAPSAAAPPALARDVQLVTGALDDARVRRGQALVQSRCLHCHGADDANPSNLGALAFFENPNKPMDQQGKQLMSERRRGGFLNNIEGYLSDGTMPMDGDALSAEERADVLQYVQSLQRPAN